MKECGPQSKGSRNPEKKRSNPFIQQTFGHEQDSLPGAWDTEKIKTWSHVSRSSVEQRYSTVHRKGEVARLPGEHRRGVQPDRGLREGFSGEGVRGEAGQWPAGLHHVTTPFCASCPWLPRHPGWSPSPSFGVPALMMKLALPLLSGKPDPPPPARRPSTLPHLRVLTV